MEAEGLEGAIRASKAARRLPAGAPSRALDMTEVLLQARWLVLAAIQPSVPVPFLVILLSGSQLHSRASGCLLRAMLWSSQSSSFVPLSVSLAVFLVLEMDSPFDGLLKVSADPLRYAYAHLNQ